MEKRVSFTPEQENSLLRLINGVNFDYTFVYDCETDSAKVTGYADDKTTETYYESGFVDFIVSRVHPDDYSLLEKEIKIPCDISLKNYSFDFILSFLVYFCFFFLWFIFWSALAYLFASTAFVF